MADLKNFKGKIFKKIEKTTKNYEDELVFTVEDDSYFIMRHDQD